MYGAYRVNNNGGALKVTNIAIPGENTITGVLYEPLTHLDDAPCVLLAHGITNSKESLSGVAFELAKHGYFALSIDLVGHGRSSGALDGSDPSLGVVQAAEYLLDYTKNTHIGLVGHSLGAGAVYYVASHGVPENGVVLIGGGIGFNYYTDESGGFMPSHPWNPLVIIGRYDVLFDETIIQESLQITFPANTPELNTLKGESTAASMTMLLMPYTSHLFEPVDPVVVASTVDWFNTINHIETNMPQTYLTREAFILFAFIFFIAALTQATTLDSTVTQKAGFDWRNGAIYGVIGFICFIPSMLLGNVIPFPPQLFGSSIAWWLLIWGVLMYLYARFLRKDAVLYKINGKDVGYALLVFFGAYVFCLGLEYFLGFGYRLIVPIFRVLFLQRAQSFILYLPFMLAHFYSESIWFREELGKIKELAISKIGLFTAFVLVQYGGFYLLDTVFVSGFIGFILEFIVAIVPMLLISVLVASYSQRCNRVGVGVILNTLIFSWIAAGLFPY